MNKQELALRLAAIPIPQDAYCLHGGLPHEAYCLNQTDDGWEVYYSERGSKTGLTFFSTETDACQYLYHLVRSDLLR
ncbi:hypothetical protein [Spirosoma gilvum]